MRSDPPLATSTGALMVLDDDDLIHEGIRRALRSSGWHVTSFVSADDALAHLEAGHRPDVLIVDQRMPRLDGVDFLEQLQPRIRAELAQIYLCSGVTPPAAICARIERVGGRLLAKDALSDRRALLAALTRPRAA